MANKTDFLRALKEFQFAHTPEHDERIRLTANEIWLKLSPAQQANACEDDARARVWAAAFRSGRKLAGGG